MSDSKQKVTIAFLNGETEVIEVSLYGCISTEGEWLIVNYDSDFAVAGFRSSHVKSWRIGL